jgi:hypothetical protein
MAKTNTGVLGMFIGTIGPVTGFIRNGKNVLRTSTSAVRNQRTPLQLAQREKIRICNQFTRAFAGSGFFSKTFPAYGHAGTGFNRVTGTLLSLAITGAYPNMQLNYPQVLVSKGSLPGANSVKLTKKNNTLQFSSTDNSGDGIASPNDTVILVAYAPDIRQAVFSLYNGFRKDKKASLNVTALKGLTVETWIGFLSADEQDASDSVWVGRIAV